MITPLRVLVVEDSKTDAKLVAEALRGTGRPVEFERVEDAQAMRTALEKSSWDFVISDWSMPHFSAYGALEVLKQTGLDLPFIIVSGTVGEELAVDAMRAGAHDYVLKDKLVRLVPAVERELRECADRKARRQAEAALRAQEARFRALVEGSEDGISLAAADGTMVYMSPAAHRIFGTTPGQPTRAVDVAHPDDREAMIAAMQRLRAGPSRSVTIQFRAICPDGSCRWIEGTATNLLDDPTINAVVGNFRDITTRKLALEELAASEARYRRILETTNEGAWLVDAAGDTTFMNARMATMLGCDPASALGVSVMDFVPEAWREVAIRELERRREGVAGEVKTVLRRRDGTELWAHLSTAPIFDERGRYEGALAMVTDATEQKRAEEALITSENQLRQAQKMEAVGRLAAGIAHDFNNLLSIILCFSDLMLDDLDAMSPMRGDVDEVKQAATRASELTRQLLMFSRQNIVEPRVLDLNEVLARTDKMLRRILGEDVDLVSVAASALGRVRADPGSIEQVIMNLAVNARDAMPTGGKLTMETANVTLGEDYAREHLGVSAGPHVMLAISDTGFGMDKATQARVFEPFFTTKEKGKGTGLGLSTVFGIVQQSGGSVWLYSEVGRGTTFKVYLPRVDEQVVTSRSMLPAADLRGSETILLVEDEEQLRAAARTVLRKNGYDVIEARSAAEALLLCEQHTGAIHLLLSDVVMPQLSGPELAKRLAAVRPGMRVLFMSGYTDDSVVRHGVLESEIAFLQKPFTPETLMRKVRSVLEQEQGARST